MTGWNKKHLKMYLLLETVMFHCHVSFQGSKVSWRTLGHHGENEVIHGRISSVLPCNTLGLNQHQGKGSPTPGCSAVKSSGSHVESH